MTCKNIEDKISMYLDGDLPQIEVEDMNKHIENCEACKALFEDMKLMHELMVEMPQMELPEGFEAELHEKLVIEAKQMEDLSEEQEDQDDRKVIQFKVPNWKTFKRHSKPLTALAATVLIAFLAYGADSVLDVIPVSMKEAPYEVMEETAAEFTYDSDEAHVEMSFNEVSPKITMTADSLENSAAVDRSAMVGTMMAEPEVTAMDAAEMSDYALTVEDQSATPEVSVTSEVSTTKETMVDSRMIIYSADVALDIVDYDYVYENIVSTVNRMGGYVGNANTSYKYYDESDPDSSLKYGRLTIRVPQEKFMETLDLLEEMGVRKNLNIWSQDITSQYRDIADEVANLEIRETKLREIMETAELIEDVITVERELSRVRGEINNYMGTLKEWDRLVSLSTITIELNEVETLEPRIKPIDKTLIQKAKDGFVNSINQLRYLGEILFIGSVAFFPKLIVWIIIFFIGYKIVRWLLRKFRK